MDQQSLRDSVPMLDAELPSLQVEELLCLLERWDPDDHPTSCANCRYAVVYSTVDDPQARCQHGHGPTLRKARALRYVVRPAYPFSWRQAQHCPDFVSMS